MEKQKKKKSPKVDKMKKETKRKHKDAEKYVDDGEKAELVESVHRKKTKVKVRLSEDLSKPHKVKEVNKISENVSTPDNVKKKKRKKSLELTENDESVVSTSVNQEHVKKKKKQKTKAGHASEQTLPKQVSDPVSDNISLEDIETNETEKDSSQGKKRKKKKQKEDIPEGELDNSEQDIIVPKKKKVKKKNKNKDVEDKPSGSDDTSISAQTAAIDYLKTWAEDNASWKFQKVRQVWLLQHMYDDSKVPNTDFERLLLYIENLKGKAKEETMTKASKIIEEDDSSSDEDNNGEGKTTRARQVMQMLN